MIRIDVSLDQTPGGMTAAAVNVESPDTHYGFRSLHSTRREALDNALATVKAEVEDLR